MDDFFVLDRISHLKANFIGVPRIEKFVRGNLHAKRFRISPELEGKLLDYSRENLIGDGVWDSMRAFAKPPFDSVFVEYSAARPQEDGSLRESKASVLWADGACVMMSVDEKDDIVLCPFQVAVSEQGYTLNRIEPPHGGKDPFTEEDIAESKKDALSYVGMTEVLWLLMHRPGNILSRKMPSRQKVVKGKLRPSRAHSVLTIDLALKDVPLTITADGSRGSGVREHEVRGTWVHLNHVRSCTHQWGRVDRPAWRAECWACPTCGTRRVWRIPHVRGEHKRGNKFHTYVVKDSNLDD